MNNIINEIREINKENDEINTKINISKAKISKHINNIKLLNYGSILMLLEEIALGLLLPPILPLKETIVLMIFFYLTTKGALTIAFGTRKSNKKNIIKFNNIINESTTKQEILTNQLNNMKENIRTNNENREKIINNTSNNLDIKNYYNTKKTKKRILKINKAKSIAN